MVVLPIFLFQTFLSFIVGTIWLCSLIIIARKFGSKKTGIIAGIPSIVLISILFISITTNKESAIQAIEIMPIAICGNYIILLTLIKLKNCSFNFSFYISLLLWLIFEGLISVTNFTNFLINILLSVTAFAATFYIINKSDDEYIEKITQSQYSFKQVLNRSMIAGFIIALSVFFGKIAGTVFGGIIASFPGVLISTLIISNKIYGRNFSLSISKLLVFSAAINILSYIILLALFYKIFNIWISTILALSFTLITSYFMLLYQNYKTKNNV